MASPPVTDIVDLSRRIQRTRVDRGKQRAVVPSEADEQDVGNAGTARIDSMNVALPRQPQAPKWKYYSLNSSLSRKKRLDVLADRFGSVRAESLEQATACAEPIEFTDSASPPSDQFLAYTSAVEEQQKPFNVDNAELSRSPSKTSLPSLSRRNKFYTKPQEPSTSRSRSKSVEGHSTEFLLDNHATSSPSSTVEHFIPDKESMRSITDSLITQSIESLSQATFYTFTTDSLSSHLPSSSSRRLTIDNESRPKLVIPTPTPSEKKRAQATTAFLNTLCCRPGAVTPPFTPRPTRLPICAGAVLPKRIKMKPKWLRKSKTVKFDMVQKGRKYTSVKAKSSSSFGFDRHRRQASRRRRSTSSASSPTRLNGAVSSDMIQRAPGSVRNTSTPGSGSMESGVGRSPSLEERLRNMSLDDLPLRESEVAHISEVLRDVERDSVGSENPSLFSRGADGEDGGDDDEDEDASIRTQIRKRLSDLDDEVKREVMEKNNKQRQLVRMLMSNGSTLSLASSSSSTSSSAASASASASAPPSPAAPNGTTHHARPPSRRTRRRPRALNGDGGRLVTRNSRSSLRQVQSMEELEDEDDDIEVVDGVNGKLTIRNV